MYPELQGIGLSTVCCRLKDGDLQYMRAKMRDPRRDASLQHIAEFHDFQTEQQKTDGLMSGPLFFMDETIFYMNETKSRAWGTKTKPGEILKLKGKTMTIRCVCRSWYNSYA